MKSKNEVFNDYDEMVAISHNISNMLLSSKETRKVVELRFRGYIITAMVSVIANRVCVSIFNTVSTQFVLNHELRSLSYNINKSLKLL